MPNSKGLISSQSIKNGYGVAQPFGILTQFLTILMEEIVGLQWNWLPLNLQGLAKLMFITFLTEHQFGGI